LKEKSLVKNTPQYTGNLATNWYISLGDNPSYNPIATYVGPESWKPIENPYIRGHELAVSTAYSREIAKLSNLSERIFKGNLRQVKLVNPTPYASEVEAGIVPSMRTFRPGNAETRFSTDIMKSYIVLKYGKLKYGGL
jgi:hypothetical protein